MTVQGVVDRNERLLRVLGKLSSARQCLDNFHAATGLGIRVTALGVGCHANPVMQFNNPFCKLLAQISPECRPCLKPTKIVKIAGRSKPNAVQTTCPAGMIHVALPIYANGQYFANLECGQVFSAPQHPEGFAQWLEQYPACWQMSGLETLRTAYQQMPVLNAKQIEAALRLLPLVAQKLGELALANLPEWVVKESKNLQRALDFIHAHYHEPISTRIVAQHVNLCTEYFCRLFRKETGQTFTQYLNQYRLDKAKQLLKDSSKRITELCYETGFSSVWQFNHVFRKATQMNPSEYRAISAGKNL